MTDPWNVIGPLIGSMLGNNTFDYQQYMRSKKRPNPRYPSYGGKYGKKRKVGRAVQHTSHGVQTVTKTKKKTKRKTTRKNLLKAVKKNVKRLNELAAKNAIQKCRRRDYGSFDWTPGACNYVENACFYQGFFDTLITTLKFIDRGATPAADSINLTATSLSRHTVSFKNLRMKITVRNNDDCPHECRGYFVRCNNKTSTSFINDLKAIDGLEDATIDTNNNLFPTEIKASAWKVISSQTFILKPGDEAYFYYNQKGYRYQPRDQDIEGTTYDKGDINFVLRGCGRISHDSTNINTVGSGAGYLNYEITKYCEVHYPSDYAARHWYLSNNSATTIPNPVCATHAVDRNAPGA